MEGHFEGIIFDLDGTLLNTLEDLASAGNHVLATLGYPVHPVEKYKKMVGNGIPKLVENMLPLANRGPATREIAQHLFSRYYTAHMFDATIPYPGILKLLRRCRAQGICLAVLSNKADPLVKEICEKYFPGIFDYCLGLNEIFLPKPAPDSCLLLVEQMHLQKNSILYCGDSDVDMLTAKNAGLTACGVLWGFPSEEELQQAGADILCQSPGALEDLLFSNRS